MALISGLFTGVTGLNSQSQGLEILGDNISNVNTVGFKSAKPVFGAILTTLLNNGPFNPQVGRGASMIAAIRNNGQGSFETSENALDLAVDGSGFFIVNNGSDNSTNPTPGNFYTRAGQFRIANDGLVKSVGGEVLQGFEITQGNISSELGDIDLAGVQSKPMASTDFTVGANLNASASAGVTFQSPLTLYNSAGSQVILTLTFTKLDGSNSWNVTPTSSSGTVTSAASTTFTFDTSGQLAFISPTEDPAAATGAVEDQTLTVTFDDTNPPAETMTLNWDLADTLNGVTASNGKLTAYAAESNNNAFIQNGFTTGTLIGVSVDTKGIIQGIFNNGQTELLYQVGLADFLSHNGLTRQGANLFAEAADSGAPIIGSAQTGGFGTVLGSTLELSNVDLAFQFVSLIQTQQGFQASARIINTIDDLLTETVNLVR